MKSYFSSLIFFFLLSVFSCDLLRDSPYYVVAWTPGEGFHADPSGIKVSLLLSHESDRAKTEGSFSLAENGKAIEGSFLWEDTRLVFTPVSPLEAGRDYLITLGTGAQDNNGLSLEKKFEAFFTTQPDGEKPEIVKTEPVYGGSVLESREEFRVFFSAPVCLVSCADFISFSPSVSGSWRLEDENRTACFTPREPWQAGTQYRVKVESAFAGISGRELGTDYTTIFSVGADRGKPVLLKVFALFSGEESSGEETTREEIFFAKNNPGEPGNYPAEGYSDWESFTRLELVFSEPVDLSGLGNLLLTEPAMPLILETVDNLSERVVFSFAEIPKWGTSFLFRLSPGVKDAAGNESEAECLFRIVVSGLFSKAPVLMGIRLPMSPAPEDASENHAPLFFTNSKDDLFSDMPIEVEKYPYSSRTYTWIELYFETAPDTAIDLFSVMELFRVEATSQALVFSSRNIVERDFTWPDPQPGWEDMTRLEVRGYLTNSVNSGLVTFCIPAGLTDERGNRSTEDFRISLLK